MKQDRHQIALAYSMHPNHIPDTSHLQQFQIKQHAIDNNYIMQKRWAKAIAICTHGRAYTLNSHSQQHMIHSHVAGEKHSS